MDEGGRLRINTVQGDDDEGVEEEEEEEDEDGSIRGFLACLLCSSLVLVVVLVSLGLLAG